MGREGTGVNHVRKTFSLLPGATVRTGLWLDNPPKGQVTDTTDLYIFDEIGDYGVDGSMVARMLAAITTPKVTVHLHSPGGNAYDGVAIYTALQKCPARVRVEIEGLAASAASIIAMAGDEIVASTGSILMVHDAWMGCVGNAADMIKASEMLGTISESMAEIYGKTCDQPAKKWRAMMQAETWFTAEEALKAGLVHAVLDPHNTSAAPGVDQMAQDAVPWDLTAFTYAGRSAAPDPRFDVDPGANVDQPDDVGDVFDALPEAMEYLPENLGDVFLDMLNSTKEA